MKKHCGCSLYDKCDHEIAAVGATPKEEATKDGKEEKVDVEKKDRCWDGYEPVPGKKPYEKGSCAPIKKHEEVIEDIMKSWEGPESPCTCGAESMSMVPMGGNKVSPNPALVEAYPDVYLSTGLVAENHARESRISRDAQDAFALRSHQRALAAIEQGNDERGIVFPRAIAPFEIAVVPLGYHRNA